MTRADDQARGRYRGRAHKHPGDRRGRGRPAGGRRSGPVGIHHRDDFGGWPPGGGTAGGDRQGTGQWLVNDRPLEKFFPNKVHQQLISEPLVTLGAEGQFDIVARVTGGGVAGQAGALRLGIARALTVVDPENRPTLKRAGFLTRDARVTERKKYGLKKARKAPQYSKR